MENPKISVLIPAYNAARTIEKCVRSVMRQTYKNIEIIVMEDGGADKTLEILRGLEKQEPRLRVFTKQNEKNVAITRNALLEKITGEYFTFADADDWVSPYWVKELYKNMTENDSDMSVCAFKFVVGGIIRVRPPFLKKHAVYSGAEMMAHFALDSQMFVSVWNKLYKTEIAKGLRFDPTAGMGNDFLYIFEYLKKCRSLSFFRKPLYWYVKNKDGATHEKLNKFKLDFLDRLHAAAAAETDLQNKGVLWAWIALTSALYYQLAKKQKNITDETRQDFADNMAKYEKYLLGNKATGGLFRFIYKFIRRSVRGLPRLAKMEQI